MTNRYYWDILMSRWCKTFNWAQNITWFIQTLDWLLSMMTCEYHSSTGADNFKTHQHRRTTFMREWWAILSLINWKHAEHEQLLILCIKILSTSTKWHEFSVKVTTQTFLTYITRHRFVTYSQHAEGYAICFCHRVLLTSLQDVAWKHHAWFP